ncbi:MAG: LL-diaminopimelate aminotransferase [Negativicutes bacterium]|nr:LL-diaminopimelate aminotransferase [Negativicutes bacterium]
MRVAERISKVPPYLFATIDKKKREAIERGVDIISFGIGDPDRPTPPGVIEAMTREIGKPENHRYPDYEGCPEFRRAVAEWYRRRFGITLDPDSEVITLIGSKEGIAHIYLAYVDPGDYSLVPDPAYPVYRLGTLFAGGQPHTMPLLKKNKFLPDFSAIPSEIANKAKIMMLNYPNNPTGAVADLKFFAEAVAFCREYDIVLCHDCAYSEMTFDGYRAPSLLQVEGARELAVEFNSLSKPFNMTGWRLGFAVGCREVISALGIIKTNVDSGQFTAVQKAGIAALLDTPDSFLTGMNEIYRRRRDVLVAGLNELGLKVEKNLATFYLWVEVPDNCTSIEFASLLLDKCGIICVPGTGYGEYGEGYVRFALTVEEARIGEALMRMKTHFGRLS